MSTKECPEELDPYKSFVVHTPMTPLSRTNTSALALEFCSWLFLWLGTFGRRFLVTGKLIKAFSCSRGLPILSLYVLWCECTFGETRLITEFLKTSHVGRDRCFWGTSRVGRDRGFHWLMRLWLMNSSVQIKLWLCTMTQPLSHWQKNHEFCTRHISIYFLILQTDCCILSVPLLLSLVVFLTPFLLSLSLVIDLESEWVRFRCILIFFKDSKFTIHLSCSPLRRVWTQKKDSFCWEVSGALILLGLELSDYLAQSFPNVSVCDYWEHGLRSLN